MTYKGLLEAAIADKASWSHLDATIADNLDLTNHLSCDNFIQLFLTDAGKEYLDIAREHGALNGFRQQHIVSTFFLGVALYHRNPRLKALIDVDLQQYKGFILNHEENPFPFIWFLICLFHDLAYRYENEHTFSSFQEIKDKYGSLGSQVAVPSLYIEELHREYFSYMYNEHKKHCDHGICAGYMLYKQCCELRKKNHQQTPEHWDPRLDKVYNYAAWVVACHNMWTANENTKKLYNETYKLRSLDWTDGTRLIKIADYPVFFLFALVDSIEPIKVVREASLFDRIYVEVADEMLKVDVKLTCGCRERLHGNMDKLNSWLTNVHTQGDTRLICLHY